MPQLHDPVAIIAFAGWNDAAGSATQAARFVVRRLGARKFAAIDPEQFYDFRESRPSVHIRPNGSRDVQWPVHEFFFARNPLGPHDVVVGVGVEPGLRWRTFAEAHASLFRDLGVVTVVSLGALLADAPHTRPVRVTGTAQDPDMAARLNLTVSRYEGPTGIVGVMHDALRRAGLPAASFWANVPHYVTANQNPLATAALIERIAPMIGMEFDTRELKEAGERFISEVDAAMSANHEIADYVRRLEAAVDAGGQEDQAPLPKGEDLVLDVEQFLREQRGED